ncbi:hypothetical protein KKH81_01185 [Patescibacteria group bacterium]|nr:hypothetical protein [Patescibacteria group bacterium]
MTRKYDLFALNRVQAPLGLELIDSIDPVLESVTFVGDTLYGTQWTEETGANLWKISSDASAEMVYTFPVAGHHRIIR